jgi:hypothetical protein
MNLFDDFDTTQLALRRPPANDSLQTFKELQELNNLNVDHNVVEDKDDIVGNFEKINTKNNVPFPKDEVTKIQDDSSSVIKSLKKHFNRPRPKEIANQLGVKMDNVELPSMKTASYPSGHSAQSRLIAKLLSEKNPELKNQYQKEANEISDSRNIGRAHFKSDSTFGKEVGDKLYQYLKEKNYAI